MATSYAFIVELPQPLPAALETLRAALAAEQFGIVSEVDLQATFKARLGLDVAPQRLLGVCSPPVARALLTAEPDLAALLPCGCGLTETAPGHTRLALQDPGVIAAVTDSAAARTAAEGARAGLLRVVERLRGAGAAPAG